MLLPSSALAAVLDALVVNLNSTNGTGVARNCNFFGATKPLQSANTTASWTADHCCTDVANFTGDAADGGGNLFSRVAANQFVSETTDLHPKTGADGVGAGATDTTYNTVGDDIFENTRVVPWDIGPVKFLRGNIFFPALHGAGGLSAKVARLSSAASTLSRVWCSGGRGRQGVH